MGGIIASKYIQEGNKDKVDKLITIGTPYFGAPKALYVFENLVIKPIYEKNEADNISKDDKPTDEGDKIEEDDGKNSETSDQNNLILIMGIMVLVGGLLKNTKDTVKRL